MTPLVGFLLARIGEDEFAIPWGECRCGNIQRPDCPDRITADCEAKRQIVEFCEAVPACAEHGVSKTLDCDECAAAERVSGYDVNVLELLALPYADHADFREEWRP